MVLITCQLCYNVTMVTITCCVNVTMVTLRCVFVVTSHDHITFHTNTSDVVTSDSLSMTTAVTHQGSLDITRFRFVLIILFNFVMVLHSKMSRPHYF